MDRQELDTTRARELARLNILRKVCVEAGQDPQKREHAERLIIRIDAMRRRLGAHDATH